MTFSKLIKVLSSDGPVPEGTRLPNPQIRIQSAEGHVVRRSEVGGAVRLRDIADVGDELDIWQTSTAEPGR